MSDVEHYRDRESSEASHLSVDTASIVWISGAAATVHLEWLTKADVINITVCPSSESLEPVVLSVSTCGYCYVTQLTCDLRRPCSSCSRVFERHAPSMCDNKDLGFPPSRGG